MKKKELAFLFLIGLIIPSFFLWKNVFTIFEYDLSEANNHGIMIKKKELEKNTFLLLPYYKNYSFGKIDLKLKFKDDFYLKKENQLKLAVYENYESMAYPIKGEIDSVDELKKYLYFNNRSSLPNGTIFSNGESAYFISRGEYRPILAGEIFEKLGFSWDDLVSQETEIFSLLKEGEKIVFNSAHPDGVILEVENEFYLVWEEQLIRIKDEKIIKEAWSDYFTISSAKLSVLDSCDLKINKKEEIYCSFDVSNYSGSNKPYLFEFNQGDLKKVIDNAYIRLKVSRDPRDFNNTFLMMLSNIKKDLLSKYGGYLF